MTLPISDPVATVNTSGAECKCRIPVGIFVGEFDDVYILVGTGSVPGKVVLLGGAQIRRYVGPEYFLEKLYRDMCPDCGERERFALADFQLYGINQSR